MSKDEVTSVVALHTFMTKLHGAPVYEFLNKFGKSHKPWFRYRCAAMAEEVFGTGRSKGNAKQVVALKLLQQLSLRGYKVPPQFSSPDAIHVLMGHKGLPTHNFIVLVNELCAQHQLDAVVYKVFPDPTGKPIFTVTARIGYYERTVTGSSKRIAQHLAAEQIYRYLRTMLIGVETFNEEPGRALAPTSDEETADDRRADEEPWNPFAPARMPRRQMAPRIRRRLPSAAVEVNRHPATAASVAVPSTSAEASAARRPSRRNRKKKNRRSRAAQAAARMEQTQSEQGGHEVGPEAPPSPNGAFFNAETNIAMHFLSRTMERLGM